MTTTPDIQVPGQLELPLEFEEPIVRLVKYTETTTEHCEVTVRLEVPAKYKPLIDQIENDSPTYQRTLRSLLTEPEKYEGVSAPIYFRDYGNEEITESNYRIV